MAPDDILGKIINHDMLIKEVNHVKNLSKDTTSSRKQDIAFKDSKKGKSEKVVEESSSEEKDDDDESIEGGRRKTLHKKVLQDDEQAKVLQGRQEG
jgi:hypothetical protein